MMQKQTNFYGSWALKSAPSDPAAPKKFTFRASDGDYDRYEDRLNPRGWKLDGYAANPVILYNHDAGDGGPLGIGRKDVLPIGRGHAYVQGDALLVDVTFDQNDTFALDVQRKVEQGILNAVSVRYIIPEGYYRTNERGGLDSDVQELLEISIVTIPGNQRAVRLKRFETWGSASSYPSRSTPSIEIKEHKEFKKIISDCVDKVFAEQARKRAEISGFVSLAMKLREEADLDQKIDAAVRKRLGVSE